MNCDFEKNKKIYLKEIDMSISVRREIDKDFIISSVSKV